MNRRALLHITVIGSGFILLPIAGGMLGDLSEVSRAWIFQLWTLVLGALFFISGSWKEGIAHGIFWNCLAFLFWATVASLLGQDIEKSIVGNYFRADGLLTLLTFVLFALFTGMLMKKQLENPLSLVIATGAAILSIVSLFSHLVSFPISPFGFRQPIFEAGFLVVTLPFVLMQIDHFAACKKLFWIGLVFVELLLVVFAKSEASLVIMFLAIALWNLNARSWRIVLASVLAALTVLFMWWNSRPAIFIYESRERIYRKLAASFIERPVAGYGWSNIDYAFETGVWPMKFNDDIYLDKAHSHLLEILITTGAIGIIIYLILLINVYQHLRMLFLKDPRWGKAVFVCFAAFVIHSQTNVVSVNEELFFWFAVGQAMRLRFSDYRA
jgi:hypothetical protein